MFELGIPLSREEAGKIVGGAGGEMCVTDADCPMGSSCDNGICGDKRDRGCPTDPESCPSGRECRVTVEGKQYDGVCGIRVVPVFGTRCVCIET